MKQIKNQSEHLDQIKILGSYFFFFLDWTFACCASLAVVTGPDVCDVFSRGNGIASRFSNSTGGVMFVIRAQNCLSSLHLQSLSCSLELWSVH